MKAALARLADRKVVPTLTRLLDHPDGRVQMEAARELLNRVLGRPKEDVKVEHGAPALQAFLEGLALRRLRGPAYPALARAVDPPGGQAVEDAVTVAPEPEGNGLSTRDGVASPFNEGAA